MTPRERLSLALLDTLGRGLIVPCRVAPDRWTSDDAAERRAAAIECQGCPIFDACDEAGAMERHHVWAGRDRTPTPTKKARL